MNDHLEEVRRDPNFVEEKSRDDMIKQLKEMKSTNPNTKGVFYNICWNTDVRNSPLSRAISLYFIIGEERPLFYLIWIKPEGFYIVCCLGDVRYSSLDSLLKDNLKKEELDKEDFDRIKKKGLGHLLKKGMKRGSGYGRLERKVARRLRHKLSKSLKWTQADQQNQLKFTHDLSQQILPGSLLLPAPAPVSYRLPRPRNEPYYARDEAANLVFSQTVNNTSERSLIMNDMVNGRLVPVKLRNFQRLISKLDYPKLQIITGKKWGYNPGEESFQLRFEGPRKMVKVDHGKKDYGNWVGRIHLRVAKVNHLTLSWAVEMDSEHLLRQEIMSSLNEIDICSYLGKMCQETYDRDALGDFICRLYLDPDKFPLPPAGVKVASSLQFNAVKGYIRLMAMKAGNPVVCNGSNGKEDSKVFRCAECYRKKSDKVSPVSKYKASCDFSLTLKWDSIGFYIHLNEFGSYFVRKNVGNNIHTCCYLLDHMFRDSYGVFDL